MSATTGRVAGLPGGLGRMASASRLQTPLIQVAALGTILVAWQIASRAAGSSILPGPFETWPVFVQLLASGRFLEPLAGSLGRATGGFVLAFALGIAYGIAAGRSPRFERATMLTFQFALFANTLVLILWGLAILGNANPAAVVTITALAVFPVVGVYLRDTVKSTDEEVVEMAQAYRASRVSRIRDVYLPFLAPSLLGSSRIAFSQCWKVVMLCEVFGYPGGIGYQIRQAYTAYNLASVISWLAVFIMALLAVEQLIRLIDRRVVRWR